MENDPAMGGRDKEPIDTGGGAIRTFLCIEIPDTIKARIGDLQRALKQIEARVSWVKPENIHLTLKFLGAVPASRIPSVCEAVSRAASHNSTFEVEVSGTGCFPSVRNPRVLWVGLTNLPNELRQLHKNLEDELAGRGFPRDSKRFAPHLTIGRIRSPEGAPIVARELIEVGFESALAPATRVIVMRSDLRPTGSLYTPQALIELPNRG
jgi:RNA 2',3'-cyclic 3'-phosphodiesterase